MKYLLLIVALLSGCANLRYSAQASVAADAVTSAAGIGAGVATEANPLLGSPAALAGSLVLRVAAVEVINATQPEPARTEALAAVNSVWWGVVVSNTLVLIAASTPVGLAAGVMVGLGMWRSTGMQREFAAMCAAQKLETPALVCVYKAPR